MMISQYWQRSVQIDFDALIEAAIFMHEFLTGGAALKDEHEKDAFHVLRFKRND